MNLKMTITKLILTLTVLILLAILVCGNSLHRLSKNNPHPVPKNTVVLVLPDSTMGVVVLSSKYCKSTIVRYKDNLGVYHEDSFDNSLLVSTGVEFTYSKK